MRYESFVKATRANFLPASILPFFVGAFFAYRCGYALSPWAFVLGVVAAGAMHLAGNVFNNYFDYVSGADGAGKNESPFFGGSRVIQDGLVSERELFSLGAALAAISVLCVLGLSVVTGNRILPALMVAAGLLTYEYTAPPFKFAYRMAGEIVIFLLFGVCIVTGSFYLFAGRVTWQAVFVSLPVAFLVAAIIICNEIPDHETDTRAGKYNLIHLVTPGKGYILYASIVSLSCACVVAEALAGILPALGIAIVPVYAVGLKAACILKGAGRADIGSFIRASGMTVALHGIVGISMAIMCLIKI